MKKFLLIVLVLFSTLPVIAAVTTLTGTVVGNRSGEVRLIIYEDMISYRKKTLAHAHIDENGRFTLSANLEKTSYALIDFNFQQLEVFLQPGLTYRLKLVPEENAASQAYYDRPSLDIVILDEPGEGINDRISQLNVLYNDFLLENAQLLQSPSRKEKVMQVIEDMNDRVDEGSDPYLKDYLRYKIASLELFFRLKGNDRLSSEYLTSQPVLYGNVEYMDFFHLFFEKYLLTNNPYLPFSKTSSLINGEVSLKDILAELRKDPVLENAQLAELVLLAGMKDMAVTPGFKKERITFILDEVQAQSPYPENRLVARNLEYRLNWMKAGTPAPGFELSDVKGIKHRLSDYKGKYLYLSFIDLYSPASLAEMNLLADIYKDYRDRVDFVSIIVDELKPGWSQLCKDYRMEWDLLLAGGDIDLLEAYGATAPPLFVLIGPDGNIVRYPAPSPSEELRSLLDSY